VIIARQRIRNIFFIKIVLPVVHLGPVVGDNTTGVGKIIREDI
jgi:hypothetical protein